LSFVSAPDYENPTDAAPAISTTSPFRSPTAPLTDTQAIAVTINNVNDNAPVITSNAAGTTASVNIVENGTEVTTVTATDADWPDRRSPTRSSVARLPQIHRRRLDRCPCRSSRTLDTSTRSMPAANNVYDVTVQVSDGNPLTDPQSIAVTVTNVNDTAPVHHIHWHRRYRFGQPLVENETEGHDHHCDRSPMPDRHSPTPSSVAPTPPGHRRRLDRRLVVRLGSQLREPYQRRRQQYYDVTVQVSDGTLTDPQAIAVAVADVAEHISALAMAAVTFADNGVTELSITGGTGTTRLPEWPGSIILWRGRPRHARGRGRC